MDKALQQLESAGLNLWAAFRLDTLPKPLHQAILDIDTDTEAFDYLLLLGSTGTSYWRAITPLPEDEPHPIDHYAITQVEMAFKDRPLQILYPGNHLLPLAELGKLAGWHYTSPLGLGIHPEHGLWYAYRVLALVQDVEPGPRMPQIGKHPCQSCEDSPCIAACPARAIDAKGTDIKACIEFRLLEGSPCEETCVARLACPVGLGSRYEKDQISYHYRLSLNTIRQHLVPSD